MPGLPETMYSSQQIHIPPMFPYILRQYAKAAIKTQPSDLLRWSSHYFHALSLNAETPAKKRIEYPEPKNYMGLTPGFLKVLVKQVGNNATINVNFVDLVNKWDGICLERKDLIKILLTGRFTSPEEIPWYKFIAVCAGYLTDNLLQTMILICNTLTEEPDGGNAMISVDVFLDLYRFLATLDCSNTWYELDSWFGPFIPKVSSKIQILEYVPRAIKSSSTISTVPPEFAQYRSRIYNTSKRNRMNFNDLNVTSKNEDQITQLSEQKEMEIKTINMTEVVSDDKNIENESPISNVESSPESEEIIQSDENLDTNDTEQTQSQTVKELYQQYIEQTMVDSDRSILFRNDEHFHLNRFLQSILISPSLLTRDMSFFNPSDVTTDTLQTIYMAKMSDNDKSEEPKLIRYQIDEVKGIGPVVDTETMEYFVKYIQEIAKYQHGMIMPRNLTHFQCPPLENFDYMEEKKEDDEV